MSFGYELLQDFDGRIQRDLGADKCLDAIGRRRVAEESQRVGDVKGDLREVCSMGVGRIDACAAHVVGNHAGKDRCVAGGVLEKPLERAHCGRRKQLPERLHRARGRCGDSSAKLSERTCQTDLSSYSRLLSDTLPGERRSRERVYRRLSDISTTSPLKARRR